YVDTARTAPPNAAVSSLRWSASGRCTPAISTLLRPFADDSVYSARAVSSTTTRSNPGWWSNRTLFTPLVGGAVAGAAGAAAGGGDGAAFATECPTPAPAASTEQKRRARPSLPRLAEATLPGESSESTGFVEVSIALRGRSRLAETQPSDARG